MYTRGQLERFAAHIESDEDNRTFLDKLDEIHFEDVQGLTTCMGGEVKRVLEGTGAEHLAGILASRIAEFVTEEEILSP